MQGLGGALFNMSLYLANSSRVILESLRRNVNITHTGGASEGLGEDSFQRFGSAASSDLP